MPFTSLSPFESVESEYGPFVDMLWLTLGCCQKWFLMALYFESAAENPGSESKS